MASFSDYLELKVLDHVLSDGAFTEPANVYLGLWTSALTDASTSATAGEANYTTYARVEILATDLSAAAAGAKTNSAALTFPACTAGSSTITFFGVFDVASGAGNMILWGTVTSKLIDTSNTPPTVAISAFSATLD
jgi:hypothetical protein